MITDLINALQHTWLEPLLAAGVLLHPPLYVLKIGGSRDENRKVSFLIFSEKTSSPACIAKVARSSSGAARLREEFERQQTLHATLPEKIPCPIGLFDLFGQEVMLERVVPGQSLRSLVQQRNHIRPTEVQADLRQVFDWLARFQEQTLSGFVSLAEAIQLPSDCPPCYTDLFAEYGATAIPLVASHGDFWAGNLFFEENQLHVIDWEDFTCEKLPTYDAFFFITTYARAFPWRRWGKKLTPLEAFQRGFLQPTWLSTAIHEAIIAYLNSLNLPPAIFPLLFIHFLNEMAVGSAHSQARRGLQDRWRPYLEVYMKG